MKIITEFVYPPIPSRNFDWVAYRDGDEEGPQGHGATEEAAIAEFMEALAFRSRDTDQSPRGQLARAIAAFPALHRSWSLEALESLRGSYSLADYLLANYPASAPADAVTGQSDKLP